MHVDFAEFVLARTPALLRFAYLLTGDRHLAEDLTQEALVRAHRRWSAITADVGPEPYVRQAVLRQFLSWRRRRSFFERPAAELPERPLPDDFADRVAVSDEMWSLLRRLPRSQRAVVVLRYYEDLPDAEIARLLGCSPATVRVHAFHALRRLRAALTPARLPGGQR
ncbi:SigE family RNA polymerase sigma factor [Dactylosporangium sp. AC04546]|uniref:SigE family RNA polymerase sigma factor n=1 Tax=Dactylosporangium sp. AC04546 TaxID=2862460 RepID=UPI001EDE56A3|nr:SigE family RNA polymerase sigma factor [Dactylosporangium sp. AC04546]WVK84762.1 SigE family RNA polymerase sigma factor [Dactylosporangium sp. AC04546]